MSSTVHPLNALFLRRKNKVIVAPGSEGVPLEYVATLLKNFENLGYTCGPGLVERLQTLSENELLVFYEDTVGILRKLVGADVDWEPMYPNFPEQVMNADECELYVNALMHYLGDYAGLRIMPLYEKDERPPLLDRTDLRVIELGDEEELKDIARSLIGANTSISDTDKKDVGILIGFFHADVADFLPLEIPNKENLSYVAAILLYHRVAADILMTRYFKTATDVLRLATALSRGDVSLAKNTKFKSFKRSERRLFLSLLERCASREEDMLRHKERWIRLGERLHPGEYRKAYPKTAAAFDSIRNGIEILTFNSRVERALRTPDVAAALALLETRPGELSRRLDHLLRLEPDEYRDVVQAFERHAAAVSTPVLLQVMVHFTYRPYGVDVRTFFPKGNAAKVIAVANELPAIPDEAAREIVRCSRQALEERFSSLEPLGNVYVDPALGNHLVPFSQRSASKALRTLVRGSRVPMPEGGTIRFFLWWREGDLDGKPTGRVDLDLSGALYNDAYEYMEHISYTRLRSAKYKAAHSGDITSAPDGACEFIDLDIESALLHGARYVVGVAFAFTDHSFSELPECFMGWMMRDRPESGEVFEPSTVVDRFDLSADTEIGLPIILDLRTRQVIWADIALRSNPRYVVKIEANRSSVAHVIRAMTNLVKPDLHTLFSLHAAARGTLVEDITEADTVFSLETGITPFDVETIMADYLV
ncbi:MAG: TerD family protein [Bradymonadaceae bacterium]